MQNKTAQEIINEIEREEEDLKNHKQKKPRCLNIEVLKEMTIGKIKECEDFFKKEIEQEQTDNNISLVIKGFV